MVSSPVAKGFFHVPMFFIFSPRDAISSKLFWKLNKVFLLYEVYDNLGKMCAQSLNSQKNQPFHGYELLLTCPTAARSYRYSNFSLIPMSAVSVSPSLVTCSYTVGDNLHTTKALIVLLKYSWGSSEPPTCLWKSETLSSLFEPKSYNNTDHIVRPREDTLHVRLKPSFAIPHVQVLEMDSYVAYWYVVCSE